jgi:drug/metabolite transporter (DMT)-like permease
VAAASFYLIPVFGTAVAAAFGERLEPMQWAGALLVIGAVTVITIRAARPVELVASGRASRPPVDSVA